MKSLFLLTVLSIIVSLTLAIDECQEPHQKYGKFYGLFEDCVIQRSAPKFAMCRHCVDEYQHMSLAYSILLNTTDSKSGKSCYDLFINNDRQNLVYELSKSAQNVWSTSFCDNCYDPWSANSTNSSPVLTLDSQIFFNLTANFTKCLNHEQKIHDNVCEHCESNYTALNDLYEKLKKSAGDKLCFDIVSSMNQSRRVWSGDLNCCRDKKSPLLTFYLSGGFIFALTVMFYGTTFILGRSSSDDSDILITDITPGPLTINSEPVISTIVNRRTNNLSSPPRVTNITPTFSRNVVGTSQNAPQTTSARNNLNEANAAQTRPKVKKSNIEAARERKLEQAQPEPVPTQPQPPVVGRLINLSDENLLNPSSSQTTEKTVEPVDVTLPDTDDDQLLN